MTKDSVTKDQRSENMGEIEYTWMNSKEYKLPLAQDIATEKPLEELSPKVEHDIP